MSIFLIKSKIAEKLLGYFFVNGQAEEYTNELARILAVDAGNLDRKLKELVKEGLFSCQKKGNQSYYSLNKNYPLLKETKKLFNLKYGLEKKLEESLRKISKLEEAYLFGSYAGGNFETESDIDLLLIGEHDTIAALGEVLPLQKEFAREINIVSMTKEEFKEKTESGDEFITSVIMRKKIKLL
jgi:predicted nucleotidyltransferase